MTPLLYRLSYTATQKKETATFRGRSSRKEVRERSAPLRGRERLPGRQREPAALSIRSE